jgi:hypothetical protein
MAKGDAGRGAKGLLNALQGKLKDYTGGWNTEHVVGAGSKNIPWLNIATDAVVAVRHNSAAKINAIEQAVKGFLVRSRTRGAFHGEEFSTIYTRWILVPMVVVWWALGRLGKQETADDLRLHIRSIVTLAVISAGKARRFKRHHKGDGKPIHATPYTLFAGSRSWVYGKVDGKRTLDGEIVWHDASSTLELVDFLIGRNTFDRLAEGFVWDVINAWTKLMGPNVQSVLTAAEKTVFNEHIDHGFNKTQFEMLLQYWHEWPVGPQRGDIVIVRDVKGAALTVYQESYNTGSTSFMQWKEYCPTREKFFTMGVADPRRRTNSEGSTATVYDKPNGGWYVDVVAKDGTIWVDGKDKSIKHLQTLTSVTNPFEYAVYANAQGGLSVLYPDGTTSPVPQPPDNDDPDDNPDDDDTFEPPVVDGDKLDQIIDFVYEWLKESGLLDELKKRLVARALKELGL